MAVGHLVDVTRVADTGKNQWAVKCYDCATSSGGKRMAGTTKTLSKHEYQWDAERAAGEHRYETVQPEPTFRDRR